MVDNFLWQNFWKNSKKRVEISIQALQQGKMIVVGDDGKRENEADLVFHASCATAEQVNFAITHARGLLCVSLGQQEAQECGFSLSPQYPSEVSHTAFAQSVDASHNVGSGISASDRAVAIRLMGSQEAKPSDFLSPGHMFPVISKLGGVLERPGHTEALQDLCHFAGLRRSAAMCEILNENGEALKVNGTTDSVLLGTPFEGLCYVNTVDIFWYRVFYFLNKNTNQTLKKLTASCEPIKYTRDNNSFNFTVNTHQLEENVTSLHDLCDLSSRVGIQVKSQFFSDCLQILGVLQPEFTFNQISWEKISPKAHSSFLKNIFF
jgi:3,4-dihydroxy-2-butanone 4-phosphate synthase